MPWSASSLGPLLSVGVAAGVVVVGPQSHSVPGGTIQVGGEGAGRSPVAAYASPPALQVRQTGEPDAPASQTGIAPGYEGGCYVGDDDVAAVERYRSDAEQGDAAAQHQLGFMYMYGFGVSYDPETGVGWYRLAAEQGYAPALYDLAYFFRYGRARPGEEIEWYRRAAEQGHPRAQTVLGEMYARESEYGVPDWEPRDDDAAVKWYRRAAEQGYPRAQYRLGQMYAQGLGVPPDGEEAGRWYRLAAAQGYFPAQRLLDAVTWPPSATDRRPADAPVTATSDTRLHAAAATGDVTRIRRLLASGAAVHALDGRGYTPLHIAAANGEVGAIGALIDGGADPDARTTARFAPLHLAVVSDQVGAVNALVEAGADVNITGSRFSVRPLHLVAGIGPRGFRNLYVNRDDMERLAERHSSMPVLNALLAAGANPNVAEYLDGYTALQHAVFSGTAEQVRALLSAGANPNLRRLHIGDPGPDDFEGSPLDFAITRGNIEAIQLLVDAGVDVNEIDGAGRTPLDEAERSGQRAAAVLLRANGARTCVELRLSSNRYG